MDLGTIKHKLERKEYRSENDIKADIELVWTNCKNYNQPKSEIYKAAEKMEKASRQMISPITPGTLLRKRTSLDNDKEVDDDTLAAKVQFFKKMKELDATKLREIVQEIIRKHPSSIKEIDSEGLKIKLDDFTVDQLKDLVKFVDGFVLGSEKMQLAGQADQNSREAN